MDNSSGDESKEILNFNNSNFEDKFDGAGLF